MRTRSMILAFALLLAPVAVQAATAQAGDPDPRWQAFLGCWAPITEDGAEAVPQHVVCFREHESGAVTVTNVVDDEILSEEIILTDDIAHSVREEACSGTETATWSADGARVYRRSALRCGDSALGRESARVLALSGDRRLIDVQAVGAEDQYGVRVLHYRSLAPAEYPASMRELADHTDGVTRLYAAAPLSLDDIIEADGLLPSAAVRAMLVNLPATRFQVDEDALIALFDAGVDEEVIDVVVALAYPEKFAVATAPLMSDETAPAREWMSGSYYDPWMRYDPYGYNGYYYSPFGYKPYGWGWGGGRIIIVDRDGDDDTSGGRGTVVKGGGYTRDDGSPSSSTSKAEPRTTSSRSSVDRSSGTRSNASASPSSDSGSERGSTRQAQPKRPPGDN